MAKDKLLQLIIANLVNCFMSVSSSILIVLSTVFCISLLALFACDFFILGGSFFTFINVLAILQYAVS